MPDDLACAVADQHALDMATGNFLSHWGRDGLKAYHRYSFAGGHDAVAENVSAADNLEALDREYIDLTLTQMHTEMYAEVAPDDGHRRTILAPQHTHAGFGVALSGRALRLVELYVAKHVHLDPHPKRAKRKSTAMLKGKVLNSRFALLYAEVFNEPLPQPPDLAWLRASRSYGFPDDYITLLPKPPDRMYYADGSVGTIEMSGGGRFQIPVNLNKEGQSICTVVIWVAEKGSRKGFPATNACIQVE